MPLLFVLIIVLCLIHTHWESLAGYDILNRFLENIKALFLSGSKDIDYLSINRLGQIFLVWDIITDSFKNLILGFGPGSSLAGNLLGSPGAIYLLLTGSSGQLVAVLGDLGLSGLLLHSGLFLVVLSFALRCLKEVKEERYKVLATAFLGMWVFYVVLGPIYNLTWRYDVSSYMFWFIAAVIYKRIKENREL